MEEGVGAENDHYRLVALVAAFGDGRTAAGQRRVRRRRCRASGVESDGNGPVDASLKAIESKVRTGAEMLLYSVNAITSGSTESQGEVTVRLSTGAGSSMASGSDPDIVVASAKAYLSALNKLHSKTSGSPRRAEVSQAARPLSVASVAL